MIDKTQTVENKIKTTNSTSTQRLGVPYIQSHLKANTCAQGHIAHKDILYMYKNISLLLHIDKT